MVSIQPLFVPFGDYAIAFGGRLGRILSGYDHWYPDQPEEQAQASLNLVAGQLETHALPWMNQRSTVESLVKAYKGVNAFSRYELSHGLDAYVFIWIAYCKAYLGQNEEALASLREHLGPADKNPWPWYESARTLHSVLQEQQERAGTLLSRWASDSKVRLGLTVS